MRKLTWIAVAGALLALIVVVGFHVQGGQEVSAQNTVNFDIDPEITGNSADTLGTVEQDCYEITCPSANCTWDGSSTFDGSVDYTIDIVVTGDTQAPVFYDAGLNYDNTKVNIEDPTDPLIKMPFISAPTDPWDGSNARPDSDGSWHAGAVYLTPPNAGTPGNGTLVRVGLDIGASGVADFTLQDPPLTAYGSNAGEHAVTLDGIQLAINTSCPALDVDLSVDSDVPGPPMDMDVSVNETLHVDTTGTHTGLPLPNTVEVTISHTVTAPAGCEVNSAASASDSWTGDLAGGASYLLSTDFTIHCAEASDHTFVVENEIELLEPGYGDPNLANNTDTVNVPVEVWADSDIKINSFEVVYDRIIDSDGDTVPDIAVVDVSTPTDIIVRKVLHNNGPHGPTEVELSKTAMVAQGDAQVLPVMDSEQAVLDVSSTVTIDETFTIHCYDSYVGEVAVFYFLNNVTNKDAHIEDADPPSAEVYLPVYCVPRFTPTFSETSDEDDGTIDPPVDDICVLSLPCKSLTSVDIPDDIPKQPLAVIQTIYPPAVDIASGATITNGATVGKSEFWAHLHAQGLTTDCYAPFSGPADLGDAALPSEGTSASPYALFPGFGGCTGPTQGCGFIYWAQQLDAINNFVQLQYPGAVLWAHQSGVALPDILNIPINILIWNLGPNGWWNIVQVGEPDYDLDGLWDDVLDPDDDGDTVVDVVDNCLAVSNADQADGDGDGVGDVCDPNPGVADPTDPESFFCSPYHFETLALGETQNPSGEILRTCEQAGTHTVTGILVREDTGETMMLDDTMICVTVETDLEVELLKNELITVPQDLVHTETVEVSVYNNGAGPTDYEVELVQVSTDKDKCVSHLVAEGGDILDEYTDGNEFYSTLTWTEPMVDAYTTAVSSRDYEIVCSQSGSFPDIQQFSVDVQPITVSETDPADNTAENYVSVDSDPDVDGDTIPNADDNCPFDPENFNGIEDEDGCPEMDADNDGMPDDYEQANACLDHLVDDAAEDPDNDDLANIDEMGAGTDPCDDDSDDDTFPDGQEVSLGSDPLNVDSTPEHISLPSTCTDGIDNDLDGLPDLLDCDNDEDGIANYFDICPFTPEDMDGYQDDDGCPDPDNDMDGICDPGQSNPGYCIGSDDCPSVAEDYDAFEDSDGCPDPDNDGDFFPDYTDSCPGTDGSTGDDGLPCTDDTNEVNTCEDYDGVIDTDGCHDSPGDDYDGDSLGRIDPETGFPCFWDEVEVYLGTDPTDACPDSPTHDAWPLDMNMDRSVTVVGDVINYAGNIGAPVSGDPAVLQRLDLNVDGSITVVGDVLPFQGLMGLTCDPNGD
ncbi:MAG: hypothetical protein JSU97_02745 [Dehalococcoidia bacterium]|nr:MAG: hypothetical protein JSU97_02745 [Dehalococcoidia bacterium]